MNLSLRNLCLVAVVCAAFFHGCRPDALNVRKECVPVNRLPSISPDYSGIIIPYNIAPLNFKILEPGKSFVAVFSLDSGGSFTVCGNTPAIRIPQEKWRKLCSGNCGKALHINIYACNEKKWLGYKTIEDTISAEPIDNCVTYRVLSYLYNYSTDLSIVQRDLRSYSEKQLMNTNNFEWGCCNCHTPANNSPDRFVVQVRTSKFGNAALVADNGKISKIGERMGYCAWHPDNRLIAASVYKVQQCFHTVRSAFIDAYDSKSDLVFYDIEKGKINTPESLSKKDVLESWPTWSPDGKYLYFCSAPVLWDDMPKVPPDGFDKVQYSIMRIAYNEKTGEWGNIDTVLSSKETGLSITQPRFSHNGRFLLFCMHQYGGYPHTQKSSDIYMMDMKTKNYERLDINSDCSEAWHGWSGNDKWILFSSKRNSGEFTRIYFSYVDSLGKAHKPFIMPQKDPAFYDSYIKCYNVPEFETGTVPFSEKEILAAIRSTKKSAGPTGLGGTVR